MGRLIIGDEVICNKITIEHPVRHEQKNGKYTLHHTFKKLPLRNSDIGQAATVAAQRIANPDFELVGLPQVDANAVGSEVAFTSPHGGIELTTQTAGSGTPHVVIIPHLDANSTAWSGVKFGTDQNLEWSCGIRTDATIVNAGFWAGLKLTPVSVLAGQSNVSTGGLNPAQDADSAYFVYAYNDAALSPRPFSNNGNLHFNYSIGNEDYVTDLDIEIAANTTYNLRIKINAEREVSVLSLIHI